MDGDLEGNDIRIEIRGMRIRGENKDEARIRVSWWC
jgi:hypothetical protein